MPSLKSPQFLPRHAHLRQKICSPRAFVCEAISRHLLDRAVHNRQISSAECGYAHFGDLPHFKIVSVLGTNLGLNEELLVHWHDIHQSLARAHNPAFGVNGKANHSASYGRAQAGLLELFARAGQLRRKLGQTRFDPAKLLVAFLQSCSDLPGEFRAAALVSRPKSVPMRARA